MYEKDEAERVQDIWEIPVVFYDVNGSAHGNMAEEDCLGKLAGARW